MGTEELPGADEGGHPVTDCGGNLPHRVLADVARSEDAGGRCAHVSISDHIPRLITRAASPQEAAVWLCADEDEDAVARELVPALLTNILDQDTPHPLLAANFSDN